MPVSHAALIHRCQRFSLRALIPVGKASIRSTLNMVKKRVGAKLRTIKSFKQS